MASSLFNFARSRRTWQDALGVFIRWGVEVGALSPFFETMSASRHVWRHCVTALKEAATRPQIETALGAVPIAHNSYETDGYAIRFPATRRLGVEAWEHSVDSYFKAALPDVSGIQGEIRELQKWIGGARDGRSSTMTDRLYQDARRIAKRLRQQTARQLPSDVELPGFSLGEAHEMWDVIHGHSWVALLLLRGTNDVSASLLSPHRDDLLRDLSRVAGDSSAQAFVDFLTFDPSRHPDPALAPLVAVDDRVCFSPTLIIDSRFERNLLKLLAMQPHLYGKVGEGRGRDGARQVGSLLCSGSSTMVAEEVKVLRDGQAKGDIDVAAVDLRSGLGLMCEVKWPAPPDSILEISKAEDEIIKGQQQLARIKKGLESRDFVPRFPSGWPKFEDVEWMYAVVCGGHTPSTDRLLLHHIKPTSWDVLWHSPSDSLEQVRNAIRSDPPELEEGVGYTRGWTHQRIGPYTVEIEGIHRVEL